MRLYVLERHLTRPFHFLLVEWRIERDEVPKKKKKRKLFSDEIENYSTCIGA